MQWHWNSSSLSLIICYIFLKGCNIADILHTLLIYPYKQNYMSQIADLLLKYSPLLFILGGKFKNGHFYPQIRTYCICLWSISPAKGNRIMFVRINYEDGWKLIKQNQYSDELFQITQGIIYSHFIIQKYSLDINVL